MDPTVDEQREAIAAFDREIDRLAEYEPALETKDVDPFGMFGRLFLSRMLLDNSQEDGQ